MTPIPDAFANHAGPLAAMKRILFVDGDAKVLDGLRRMLYHTRTKWEMVFVTSGIRALELLDESEFDLLVTEIRMPDINGIELLNAVVKRHSQVIRFVLSGVANPEITWHSVALAHQYLVKPCRGEGLQATIERALTFRVLLDRPALKPLVSGVNALPSLPSSYARLLKVLQDSDTSPRDVGEIIATDVAMTAKILQVVNSAFFGLRRHISNPTDAVIYLGLETVRALALTAGAFSQFEAQGRINAKELRDHSVRVGVLARRVAAGVNLAKTAIDDCFTGGLLHDVGKLVLSAKYPEQYDQAWFVRQQRNLVQVEAERELFGVSHAEVGGYLLWLWGLPDPVIEAVVRHHSSTDAPVESLDSATVVRFANALIHRMPDDDVDIEAFHRVASAGDLTQWRQMANEVLASEIG
jgi:putative nucleotidyltransferase with HDIG domain